MEDDLPQFANLLIFALLLAANAVFTAAQCAAILSSSAKLKAPAERERAGTSTSLWLLNKLDLVMSSTQVGISVCSLLLGWFGITIFASAFQRTFTYFSLPVGPELAYPLAVIASLLVVGLLHVVLAELVAKSLALRYPEQTLRALGGMLLAVSQILRPFVFIVSASANLLLRLFGTSMPAKFDRFPSVTELSMLVSQSRAEGVFDQDEETMLRGIFGFSDTIAREIMTPRTDLVAVDVNAGFETVMKAVVDSGLSRFPVKREQIDNVVGVLLVKDLFRFFPKGPSESPKEFSVAKIMREPFFVPGTKPIDDLLNEFKKRKVHMAVVLDEHGGVDGVVTLEDVIEEIVGDIFDESDRLEHDIVVQDNGDVLVDGGMLVADLNEQFSLSIPEGDYDTIAGFIFTSLGRMTKVGDSILIGASGTVYADGVAGQAPAIGLPLSQGQAHEGSNGKDTEEREEDRPKALIRVEKVGSNRIETVRVKTFVLPEIPETGSSEEASEA